MKKIAIITLQPHTNYGGILQIYAMQTVLEKNGFLVDVIAPGDVTQVLPWMKGLPKADKDFVMQHTNRFIHRHLHIRKVDFNEIKENDYDAFVVGSDQVWRYRYANAMLGNFENVFLKFTDGWNVRRIAYAPSFGLETWEASEEIIPEISRLLAAFDAVSVREDSGVTICKKLLHREDAVHVLDPTMLLCSDDYKALIDHAETHEVNGGMACYVLNMDNEKEKLIGTVSAAQGIKPFSMQSNIECAECSLDDRIQPPLEQWLRSFRDAEFVITDSFHATVFSILFHRRFIVTGNPGRGLARIHSILSSLGLEKHLVMNADEYDPDFDYSIPESTYVALDNLRGSSRLFFDSALKTI